jgi:hypothetical protein
VREVYKAITAHNPKARYATGKESNSWSVYSVESMSPY